MLCSIVYFSGRYIHIQSEQGDSEQETAPFSQDKTRSSCLKDGLPLSRGHPLTATSDQLGEGSVFSLDS